MNKIPLTKEGEKKLLDELKKLKLDRPNIIKAIAEAREHGDLKENAEYHAAREQQGINEAKIKDIEFKLGNAEIIDNKTSKSKNQIIFGSKVELLNLENKTKIQYQLVGEDEADYGNNQISFSSPIGKGLIGKNKNDHIVVNTPSGEKTFEISGVKYI